MLKKIAIFALASSVAIALYAAENKTSAKQECVNGCCTATAKPTQSVESPLKRSSRPEAAEVYIISPKDGEVVGEEFTVVFGLKGMGIAPAGVDLPDTGHHHLLVDVENLPKMDLPIPADKNHLHFGKGQTETKLKLTPGTHTLQLLLGNFLHIPHDKEVISKKITITVK